MTIRDSGLLFWGNLCWVSCLILFVACVTWCFNRHVSLFVFLWFYRRFMLYTFSVVLRLYLTVEILRPSDLEAWGRLRSASLSSLIVRRTRLSTVGDRVFPVAAARTTRHWSFCKTGTMGTLASQAEIGVGVQAPGTFLQGTGGITPGIILRLYLQNPAVYIFGPENGSQCRP